ncbi:hypothetical protein B0H66DRAFT_569731 [Apodospora peruviana]|uniref:Citrate transporter-like domain-containing protein n=1 Tax=Apodospora peruviana TaxID=516989 RepID=A0AAE0HWE0_9PEZI|nr:hypothetical protein B0H66DRAFT_569731 [Apodospora peruviana]
MAEEDDTLNTDQIRTARSIITLVLFVATNITVLLPFHIPTPFPRLLSDAILRTLRAWRVIAPKQESQAQHHDPDQKESTKSWLIWFRFPMNFVTAPLIADLFLLAIGAIHGKEVHDGIIGAFNIEPIDIMIFFITLAYIAISIDASGLIRYLAFKVLQWGGEVGHRLFFYLYAFFFGLGSFIGNDPIILSGTAFLAYMTRVSSNIVHPRAWIHTQFAVANIASAILVSSNPTNLVLAGAFNIKFINYTANMIVPVIATVIVLFPFLLYIVFANESLIPISIKMHELPEEARLRKPVNPNIPNARGNAEEEENEHINDEEGKLLSLEEIMNPFLDKKGAFFGGLIMASTLITLLVANAVVSSHGNKIMVYWVTLPAAGIMLIWDLCFGWIHRHETREIARKGREDIKRAREEKAARQEADVRQVALGEDSQSPARTDDGVLTDSDSQEGELRNRAGNHNRSNTGDDITLAIDKLSTDARATPEEKRSSGDSIRGPPGSTSNGELDEKNQDVERQKRINSDEMAQQQGPRTLVSLAHDAHTWSKETFPTAAAVMGHLPFALIPFAFAMFVLVQGLVTKGWVPVFAYGWDHWVAKTGTIGAIGGMGFLSVILCNFAGTNIGTTILLSRVIQAWIDIHKANPSLGYISDRNFWATVYSMAIGVNYGAFSTAFSASLAGLLWRDILARKHIHVRGVEFARVNLPIIAIAMIVGLVVLVGEVYIMRRSDVPFRLEA